MKVSTNLPELATRIRARIQQQGTDWKAVAQRAGVDEGWLYRLGRPRLTIRLDTIEAVAEALDLHPRELLYPPMQARPTDEGEADGG